MGQISLQYCDHAPAIKTYYMGRPFIYLLQPYPHVHSQAVQPNSCIVGLAGRLCRPHHAEVLPISGLGECPSPACPEMEHQGPAFKNFSSRSELCRFCYPRSNQSCWSCPVFNHFQIGSFRCRCHKIRITESRFAVFRYISVCWSNRCEWTMRQSVCILVLLISISRQHGSKSV